MTIKKILIVEDESIIAVATMRKLLKLGYDVVGITANGRDAIRAAVLHRPDLVLMDIHIDGDFDGIDTARIIAVNPGCRILFFTSERDMEVLERARTVDSLGILFKPLNVREFNKAVELSASVAENGCSR